MAVRAVILAVENYGAVNRGALVSKLEGTLDDAQRFRDWLVQKKGLSGTNITLCADPTQAQIAVAFRNLVDQGQDDTEELYVFYSGHGFSYSDTPMKQKPADVLVGSEFENLNDSGNACLKLSEIQYALFQCMGPGTHYYFIDACRNLVAAKDVRPGGLGWQRRLSQLGQPAVFTLFSADRGNFAAVRSGFAPAVLDGLGGRGRAKRREGTEMWVSFDSLRAYLETTLIQKIDSEPGPGSGHILRIDPIPTYRCSVMVRNADASDSFTATLLNAFRMPVGAPMPFQGAQASLQAYPDDYFVQVTHQKFALQPSEPAKAELYEDCAVEFERTNQPLAPVAPSPAPPPPSVSVSVPAAAALEITNLSTGEQITRGRPAFTGTLQPGPYQVRVLESGWTAVRNFRFLVDPELASAGSQEKEAFRYVAGRQGLHIDAAVRDPSPLRDSLLNAIPGSHDSGTADFSEQLGPIANQDLGLWLSIAGASRILGAADFSKLSGLPLTSFDDVQPGASPTYLLVGADGLTGPTLAAVRRPGENTPLRPMQPVAGIPGLYELRVDTAPGMHMVCVQAGGKAAWATVAYCLANRATLFVAAGDSAGAMRVHQYILPLARLLQHLSARERDAQPAKFLDAIRFTALAQKQMFRMRSASPPAQSELSTDPKLAWDREAWNNLLEGKWLDPLMAIIAGYELARSSTRPDTQGAFTVALRNLRMYFSSLPDVELIAKLARQPFTEPTALPLFLTGLLALEDAGPLMPIPAAKLDYSGPWITWLGIE